MNHCEKNKNPFQPPPLPPPRHESSEDGAELQEVEEETEDTYEAPPCVMNKFIPPYKLEEEEIYSDLYLMPIADQDDIYLECGPVTRAPELNKPSHSLTSAPGSKPKIPPPKLPKPKLPFSAKRHILAVSLDGQNTCHPGTKPQVVTPENIAEDASVVNKAWYGGHCTRGAAESALLRASTDGSYMVRHSSGHSSSKQPYTLVVLYKGQIYNIPIRHLASSQSYTLGKEGKAYEELFDSISSIIEHYQTHPLVLIDSQNTSKEQTVLLCPVQP
uniref:SH2 domain-containing protein 6 isoform X2 n=1 Tax=Geotrypetes seraphini TaxID=260995 RepID=A0A6P8RLQ6_GEOSA|nr:SH2 domain-containing protein 6 isoform X2 [Geotrypetes seraphini]